jgi:PleD family two-component response regulator
MAEDKKNTVLIVDDEHVNLNILTHILEKDYTIHTAADGEGAIEKAKELLPDLILLDIVMPGTDGYATLIKLKEIEETKDIPVIFITGLSQPEEEEKGLTLGAADYILKPFSAKIIKLRVEHQIQVNNMRRIIKKLNKQDTPELSQTT